MEIDKVKQCVKEIDNEIVLLRELILSHRPLIEKLKESVPDQIDLSAAAAMLHSFYNGIENIFKRIAKRIE